MGEPMRPMPIQPIFCSFFAIPVSSLSQLAACHYDTRRPASTALSLMALSLMAWRAPRDDGSLRRPQRAETGRRAWAATGQQQKLDQRSTLDRENFGHAPERHIDLPVFTSDLLHYLPSVKPAHALEEAARTFIADGTVQFRLGSTLFCHLNL